MTPRESTPTIDKLVACPRAERYDLLESIVVAEFKATLLMSADEQLEVDESFFDAGFTSLRITEVKDRLEAQLGCDISTNVLFNSPTIERLLDHLTGDVLGELFAE